MINDSNLMFWENCKVTGTGTGTGTVTVDGTGKVTGTEGGTVNGTEGGTVTVVNGWHHVPLTSFLEPGRQGPIPISVIINDATTAPKSLTFKLYQYDHAYKEDEDEGEDEGEEIAEFKVEKDQIVKGARIGWRFLPRSVTKNWLSLGFEAEGEGEAEGEADFTFTAAIVREDLFDYSPDLLINAGRNEYGKIQALKKKSS